MTETTPAKQGTPEWLQERCGKITASMFGSTKRGRGDKNWSDTALSYCYTLVAERITGRVAEQIKCKATEWGKEWEPFARAEYQWHTGEDVPEFGFVKHPEYPRIGGSQDGLRGDDGIIEIKCPLTSKEHARTLHTQHAPKQYVDQVQGNLWVTGRQWCDFISFDNRFPKPLILCVVRVERDEHYISKLAARVVAFEQFVTDVEAACRAKGRE